MAGLSQNHLMDLVDATYIDENTLEDAERTGDYRARGVTGLMEYLQTPER
jgi:hypothetical protein